MLGFFPASWIKRHLQMGYADVDLRSGGCRPRSNTSRRVFCRYYSRRLPIKTRRQSWEVRAFVSSGRTIAEVAVQAENELILGISIRTPRLCRRIECNVEILGNTSRVGASRLPCERSRCHRRGSVRRGESIPFYDEVSLCCRNWCPHCCRARGKVPPTYLSD